MGSLLQHLVIIIYKKLVIPFPLWKLEEIANFFPRDVCQASMEIGEFINRTTKSSTWETTTCKTPKLWEISTNRHVSRRKRLKLGSLD